MHIVKFTESERGWGGEVWFNAYETMREAQLTIEECNKDYDSSKPTPSYYIIASYHGEGEEAPKGYKF